MKNRVILSGEFPDYIHAVSANVGHEIVLYVHGKADKDMQLTVML